MGEQPQLGALRARAADGRRSRDLDGVQHGHVAHPLGDPHEGVGEEPHQFATEVLAKAARNLAGAVAARSQGIYSGGNEMPMTPRQMIAFGEM